MKKEQKIINELALRIAQLEVDKAGLLFELDTLKASNNPRREKQAAKIKAANSTCLLYVVRFQAHVRHENGRIRNASQDFTGHHGAQKHIHDDAILRRCHAENA